VADNPAANQDLDVPDSPHVMSATHVRRGMTPAVWDATDAPDIAGVWKAVNEESGPADREGNVTGRFEDGPGKWEQTY
jgi:hypothetical protein